MKTLPVFIKLCTVASLKVVCAVNCFKSAHLWLPPQTKVHKQNFSYSKIIHLLAQKALVLTQ